MKRSANIVRKWRGSLPCTTRISLVSAAELPLLSTVAARSCQKWMRAQSLFFHALRHSTALLSPESNSSTALSSTHTRRKSSTRNTVLVPLSAITSSLVCGTPACMAATSMCASMSGLALFHAAFGLFCAGLVHRDGRRVPAIEPVAEHDLNRACPLVGHRRHPALLCVLPSQHRRASVKPAHLRV